jgi:hypothetical protein
MPKYKLNSGEVIDTSNFSEEEENNWLFDNTDNIDLNYDFQNGAAGTDASATPVNNPASNGDSISENGSSDGVDRSEYLLTLDDIRGGSESDRAIAIGEKLAEVGLAVDESSTYQDLSAISIKKGREKKDKGVSILGLATGGIDFNSLALGGFSLKEFVGADKGTFAIGEDLTDEELQVNLDKFNKFILENADYDFVDKARERSNNTYVNEYAPAVKATDLSEDEQKSQYIEELVDKFEDIKKKETKTVFVGEQATGETEIVPATIDDFANKKEFDDYNLWKKEEPISEIDSKTLEAWDYERREKEVLKNSGQFMSNLEPEQRLDILALAIDDRKAVARFSTNIKKFEEDQVKFEEAYSNYKSNPSNSNFLAAQDLNLKLLEDQSRLQKAQAKATASGLLKRAEAVPLAIADAQKNYNRLQQLNLGFRSTGQTVGFGALTLSTYLGQYAGGSNVITPKLSLNQVNTLLDEELGATSLSEDLAKETARNQYAIEVDDIRNLTDVGAWTMNSSINLAPSLAMASTGAFALPLFFLTGSGGVLEKRAMDQKQAASRILLNNEWLASNPNADPLEIAKRETQLSEDTRTIGIEDWRVLGTAALSGAAEVVFEKLGTMALLKSMKNGIGQVPIENMRQGFGFAAKGITKGMLQEGGSEFATTLVQNWGDIFILNGDKNLFGDIENWQNVTKGSLESFAQGALMGGGMSSINGAKGLQTAVLSEIATKEQKAAMQELVDKLSAITGVELLNINNLSDLNLNFSPDVQAQIDKLLQEGVDIEADIIESLKSGFSAADLIEIGEINRKKRSISKKLLYASSQGLSASQLTAYKNQLQKDFEALEQQRATMLSGSAGKLNRISNKFNFEATGGYAMYSAAMLNESVFNINQNYLNQNKKQKQIAFDKARAKLKAEGKPFTEADVKKKAKEDYIYDAYYKKIEQGGKTAAALAESLGLDVKIISTNSIEETLQKALEANPNMSAENIAAIKAGQVEGMRIPGENGGLDTIIVDRNQAAINKRPGVFAHEVLHSYVAKKFKGDQGAIDKAGEDLLSFLEKNDKDLFVKVKFRIDSSYTNKNENGELIKNEDYYEEVLNAMSDVLADGQKLNTGTLSKIKSFANSLLEGIGQGPFFKEDQGKDAFIFVRDYNKSAHYGKKYNKKKAGVADEDKRVRRSAGGGTTFSKSRKLTEAEEDRMEAIDQEIDEISDDLMQGFIDQDTHDRKIAKLEEEYENIENPPKAEAKPKPKAKRKAKSDIDAPQASKKDEQSLSDVTAKSKKKLDAIGNNPDGFNPNDGAIYEVLAGMIRSKVKAFKTAGNNIVNLTNLPGFEMDNMVSETLTSLIPYIKKFDPAKNDSLFGYVMAQLGNRMRGALKTGRVTENAFTEDVTTAKGIAAEESSNEVKERPKFKKFTEANVVPSEVIDAIRAKLKSTLRTLKTRMDAAVSNNRTVTPLIAEIQYEMGRQADIDLKKAMGGKKDLKLRKFLLKSKKAILENLTTTFLMGKDGKGGFPQAIQKKIDGKFVSYPGWVGEKIDRETTSTDNAGRTSGAEIVRRAPNVNRVVTDQEFLSQILDETGNPIRGRKEALAKAMAEEISFEIFSADLANPASEISEAFENNQERQGALLADNFVQQLERDIDRGNIKFSKGVPLVRAMELIDKFQTSSGFGTKTARADFQSKFLSELTIDEKTWVTDNLISPINEEIAIFMEKGWEAKEQTVIDVINNVAQTVPGVSIIQKTVQRNSFKPDVVFQLEQNGGNIDVNLELKGDKTARIGQIYISKWFDADAAYIGRDAVPSDFRDILVKKIQENEKLKDITDIIKKSFETNTYVDKNGNTQKLAPKDYIKKDEGENLGYKMPSWYFHQIIEPLLLAAEQKFVQEDGANITTALYNAKDVNYITFGDLGDFYMGLDYLGSNSPEFKGDVVVRIKARKNYSDKGRFVTINIVAELTLANDSANALGELSNSNMFIKSSAKRTLGKMANTALNVTKQTAINNATKFSYSNNPKGISVFDFDDTLARTKSNVLYVMPGGPSKVTEKEFSNLSKQEKVYYHGTSAVVDQKFVNKEIVKDFPEGASSFSVQMQGLGKHYTKSLDNAKSFIDHRNREDNTGTVAAVSISANNPKQFKTYQDLLNDIKSTVKNKDISISERNKEYLNILKSEGFDSIIYKEGPSYNPGKKSLMAEAVIPFNSTKKLIGSADYNQRNEGIVQGSAVAVKQGKLNAAQFAARSETMLEQGAEFDFSEFSKVMKGELGPLFSEAQKKEGKYTNKDIFVLTARPANSAKAIHEFLKSEGLNIPLKNITGLGNGSPQAKADWMVGKIAEGYNDFYFADDHLGNVKAVGKALKKKGVKGQTELSIVDFSNQPKAVRDILNTFDVKGPTQRSRVKFSRSMNKSMNDMLERASGIPSRKRLTRVEASELGKKKGRFKLWMPSTLDDFRGLTAFTFAGKGKQGEQDQKFFEDFLIRPYFRGVGNIDRAKQSLKNGFAALNKQYKPVLKKLGKKIPGMAYTHDQALRVYLWNKAGYEIPGLTRKLERELVRFIETDADLLAYANGALRVSQRKQWSKPDDYWNAQTILSDLNNFTEKAGRKEYLEEFIQNVDLIFSENNLNKIEAIYGKDHRQALENIIERMKSGVNRTQKSSANKNENAFNKWLNNSIGAIMFFNRRSALLQTLSTVNFVNWSDNNPLKAAQAFANQKQFWEDFVMIFNSPKLKQRRSGLNSDVNAAEIASAVTGAKDKATAALSYLLKLGFTPTQMVDSFAIASGGATFYRNRLNTYLAEVDADGKKVYTEKQAKEKAFEDFSLISDETQQSGDPALISSDQAGTLGRVVLNFMNTPIQLNRSIKKSYLDIVNRRRTPGYTQAQSDFSNVSKMVYYGFIQNAIFSTLQAGLFALIPGFNDDDEEKTEEELQAEKDKKWLYTLNSMLDTTLKGGFGIPGAVVSTIKNVIIEWNKQNDRGFMADDSKTLLAFLNLSPAVGSKARKINSAIKTERYERDVISERGFDVTIDGKFNLSPAWNAAGNLVEGAINIPLARVVDEVNSITEALDSRNTVYQRIALALGWKSWAVGAKNEENDLIKVVSKYRKKLDNKEKRRKEKAKEKLEKMKAEARANK